MLMIRKFAVLCKCSTHTLRYYDKINLLKPSYVDNKSGYRYYQKKQVEEYQKIKQFQEIGFGNDDIRLLIHMNEEEIVNVIVMKMEELKLNIEKAEQLKDVYEAKIRNKKRNSMKKLK